MKKEESATDMIKVNKIAELLMKKKNIVLVVGGQTNSFATLPITNNTFFKDEKEKCIH